MDLVKALGQVMAIEKDAQLFVQVAGENDTAERDAAIVVVRQVRPLRQMLERWISLRALRAQGVTHAG